MPHSVTARDARLTLGVPTPADSDARLLRSYVSDSSEAAFEAIVRKHGPRVQSVCRRLLPVAADADDAFQAVFLVLVHRASSLAADVRLDAWLCGVARRVSMRLRSREFRRRLRELRSVQNRERDVDRTRTDEFDMPTVLRQEVLKLPDKLRRPIELCFLSGMTVDEASNRLNCPEGTIKWRISRAKRILRQRLSRLGLASLLVLLLHRPSRAAGGAASTAASGADGAELASARSAVDETLIHRALERALRERPRLADALSPAQAELAKASRRARRRAWALAGTLALALVIAYFVRRPASVRAENVSPTLLLHQPITPRAACH